MPKTIGTCLDCKQEKPIEAKGACRPCYNKHHKPKVKCANCGIFAPRNGKNKDQEPVCVRCYMALRLNPQKICANCHEMRTCAYMRDQDSICPNCYVKLGLQPKIECGNCHEQRPHHGTTADGAAVCSQCYISLGLRPKTQCGSCGTVAIQIATTPQGLPVCSACYHSLHMYPTVTCSKCNAMDCRVAKLIDGAPICSTCYHALGLQPTIVCAECKQSRPSNGKNKDGEPVCINCYDMLELRPKIVCHNCKLERISYSSDDDGNKLCRSCYGVLDLAKKWTCKHCGKYAKCTGYDSDNNPLCQRCYKPFLCDECGHQSVNARVAAGHARTHGPWKGRSKLEEWVHTFLIERGFTQAWPSLDPDEPPVANTFWYNSRVFSDLTGVAGRRLECDFMIALPEGPKWIELHGPHHYQVDNFHDEAAVEIQQEHDRLRREFATKTLPTEQKSFSDLTFEEVPWYEFNAWKPKFAALFGSEAEAGQEKPSKRQKTSDDVEVSSHSQPSILDFCTLTVASAE